MLVQVCMQYPAVTGWFDASSSFYIALLNADDQDLQSYIYEDDGYDDDDGDEQEEEINGAEFRD